MQQRSIKELAEQVLTRNRPRNTSATTVLYKEPNIEPAFLHVEPARRVYECRMAGVAKWYVVISPPEGLETLKQRLKAQFGCEVDVRPFLVSAKTVWRCQN